MEGGASDEVWREGPQMKCGGEGPQMKCGGEGPQMKCGGRSLR